jgi:hypothetical protein
LNQIADAIAVAGRDLVPEEIEPGMQLKSRLPGSDPKERGRALPTFAVGAGGELVPSFPKPAE